MSQFMNNVEFDGPKMGEIEAESIGLKAYTCAYVNHLEQIAHTVGELSKAKQAIAEQRKQESRGGTTSRFLNYLEMQVDFPLRRISKANWLQNCYAGVTVVHRSGIFGTVDMFSNVSGGADWITAGLECVRQ